MELNVLLKALVTKCIAQDSWTTLTRCYTIDTIDTNIHSRVDKIEGAFAEQTLVGGLVSLESTNLPNPLKPFKL